MLPVPSERYVPVVESPLDEDLDPHPWSTVRLMRIWTPRGMYQYIQVHTSTYKYILVCTDTWCWLAFTACPYRKHQVCGQLVQQQRCLHVYTVLSCSGRLPATLWDPAEGALSSCPRRCWIASWASRPVWRGTCSPVWSKSQFAKWDMPAVSIPARHEQPSFNNVAHYGNMLIHGCTYQYILVCTSMYWYVLVCTVLYQRGTFMAWTHRYSN